MKKYINKLSLITAVGFMLIACNEDYLDVPPRDRISDVAVWTSETNADMFLNDIYNQLPNINNETQHLDQYSDNSDVGVQWMYGYTNIRTANVNAENFPPGPWDMWKWGKSDSGDSDGNYERIRRCNVFIKKVGESELPEEYKTLRIAEARFLRAMFYQWMWMAYGGVPVITDVLDNNIQGDEIYRPRSTDEETLTFITSELEEVADDLPDPAEQSAADYGRPNKGAALTLKGWCELFWASELRNPGNDMERWEKAAETNRRVMQLGHYGLLEDFTEIFVREGNNSMETIFARQYGANKGGSLEGRAGPTFVDESQSQENWGNFQPTQELVDEFCMTDGLTIDESPLYDPQDPYVNRENRFYQSIVYDGSQYRGFTIHTRRGISSPNEIDLGYTSDRTHTGYFARKRLDERLNGSDNRSNNTSMQNYIFFRYPEVLLSFAEAENEVNGPTAEVLAAVNEVRTRGGNMPSVEDTYGSVTQEIMREIIRRERRVELAFEDKRWWDILRWEIAFEMPDGSPGVLNRPLMGMVIDHNGGTPVYTPTVVSDRNFLEKMYYMPIPQWVLDRNPVMRAQSVGSEGWTSGQNQGY